MSGFEIDPRGKMDLAAPNTMQTSPNDNALEQLVKATQVDMEKVNALILQRAHSHVELVPELARYLIEAGGKRLRPMLTLAAASLFDGNGNNQINFAAAVEFMHNATLLHDDVVDESDMRRGKPAARKIWGNQASVLVGDFLLGQAFMMMVETGDLRALEVLSRAAATIAEGEVFQLAKAGDFNATEQDYAQVVIAKTATLFEAATVVGAMAGGASAEHIDALGLYGRELGWAFQLVDDVLDYGGTAGTLGKNTGDDLREGKMTLPVILALKAASESERAVLTSTLGNMDAAEQQIADVVAIFEQHGTLRATLREAEQHAADAALAISQLPASNMRELFSGVAEFCVSRAY